MRIVAVALLVAAIAAPANAQDVQTFTCGSFKTESWRKANAAHWTISRGADKATETAVLRSGPRFACIEGAALLIEFVPANGSPFLDLHFPDGSTIAYGGQHLERTGRFVLPVQAKARMPERFRAAFDYHCRLEMPADPITPESRKDCVL